MIKDTPTVAILLCTYNGEKFIQEQLDSFENQTHKNWKLYVSDDGSSDKTLAIIKKFGNKIGKERLKIFNGPKQGFCKNFLSLICKSEIIANYYAYSDQDDVWLNDKLERSIKAMSFLDSNKPALYGSKTILVDTHLNQIGISSNFKKPPSFQNALVQNISGANTMVINDLSKQFITKHSQNINVFTHDWWTYQVISSIGGNIIYDYNPTLYYRQHDNNIIACNQGFSAVFSRVKKAFQDVYQKWNDQNIKALENIEPFMTDKNRKTYNLFKNSRKRMIFIRLWGLYKSGIFRQNSINHLSLVLGSILGKI